MNDLLKIVRRLISDSKRTLRIERYIVFTNHLKIHRFQPENAHRWLYISNELITIFLVVSFAG